MKANHRAKPVVRYHKRAKQAAEFGISRAVKVAALLLLLHDVKAIGLETAQGLNFTETFYWDLNDQTRAFCKRSVARMKNSAPPDHGSPAPIQPDPLLALEAWWQPAMPRW